VDVICLSHEGGDFFPPLWDTEWGEKGYGWLPYEYVLKGLADEFWSLIKSEWIESGEFGL
jgi:C1A family cysteine protease